MMNVVAKYFFYGLLIALVYSCEEPKKTPVKKVQAPAAQPKLEYLTYGLPRPPDRQNAESLVAKRWGFSFKTVAGCEVTEKLTDSVAAHNHQIDLILEKKHGKEWYKPFSKLVDAELITYKKIIALLEKQERNILKNKELKKEDTRLLYYLDATPDPLVYNASAEGLRKVKNQYERVIFYHYLINLKTAEVKLTDTEL
ncbi:MAG: hypothetical protein EOP42_23095 [Sphingobacteriaceae bacterium]|nr:MAG: hypothetical protein EOP42_23095 [Sphingobacteriaceae bacterium]